MIGDNITCMGIQLHKPLIICCEITRILKHVSILCNVPHIIIDGLDTNPHTFFPKMLNHPIKDGNLLRRLEVHRGKHAQLQGCYTLKSRDKEYLALIPIVGSTVIYQRGGMNARYKISFKT